MSAKRVPQVVVPAATAKYDIPSLYTTIFLTWLAFVCVLLVVKSTFGVEWGGALVVAGIACMGVVISLDDVAWAKKRGIE
jgi:hypothetical protein